MPRQTRQNRADFHPMSAVIYQPTREVRSSGVPGKTGSPTVVMDGVRIVTPRGLYTSEKLNQQQADSRADVIVGVGDFGVTLTADMYIVHNDIRYDIVGICDPGADWRNDVTNYQCRISNNPLS